MTLLEFARRYEAASGKQELIALTKEFLHDPTTSREDKLAAYETIKQAQAVIARSKVQ